MEYTCKPDKHFNQDGTITESKDVEICKASLHCPNCFSQTQWEWARKIGRFRFFAREVSCNYCKKESRIEDWITEQYFRLQHGASELPGWKPETDYLVREATLFGGEDITP